MDYLIIVVLSIIFNLILKKRFLKFGFIDTINQRSSHESLAIRSGGSVIFLIIITYSAYLYLNGEQPYDFSFLVPFTILFVLGFLDDIKGVDFGLKFIFQIIAAKLLIDVGYVIDIFSIFGYEYTFTRIISQLITIFIFVSIFNAYNFIDGIDSNIHFESIKNLLLVFTLFSLNDYLIKLLFFTIIVLSVNLYFNNNKKIKIFTGDSGSLIIPVLILVFIFEGIKLNNDQNILKYISIIFIYPLIDLIRVVIIRIKNRNSPFRPDKNHIHHKILAKFKNHLKTSFLISICSFLLQIFMIYILIR